MIWVESHLLLSTRAQTWNKGASTMKKTREVEKSYRNSDVAKKLRRLADALEGGTPFLIQISGKRVRIPAHAKVEFEYEKQGNSEEVEIEVSWKKE